MKTNTRKALEVIEFRGHRPRHLQGHSWLPKGGNLAGITQHGAGEGAVDWKMHILPTGMHAKYKIVIIICRPKKNTTAGWMAQRSAI